MRKDAAINSGKDLQSYNKVLDSSSWQTFEKEICYIAYRIVTKVWRKKIATFKVMVPTKPDLTATGSFSEFRASAFNFKSLRTTSPENQETQHQKGEDIKLNNN